MGRLLLLSFKKSSSSPSVPQGSSCLRGQAQGGSLRERERVGFCFWRVFVCVCVFLIVLSHLLILLVLLNFFFFLPCLNVKS